MKHNSCAKITNICHHFTVGFLLLQENLAIGVVSEFFTGRHYDTAASVYSCGTGVGIVILPLLTQAFLETYGWRGSLLLLSGLCLQMIPLAALVLKPRTPRYRPMLLRQCDRSDDRLSDEGSNPSSGMERIAVNLGLYLLIRPSFIIRVLIPGFAAGYALSGWTIYIVSFGLSHGATLKESTIVATCGGVGIVLSRIPLLPIVHMAMTYKQLVYISSVLSAVALVLTTKFVSFVGMTVVAVVFGVGAGILGAELYIAVQNAVEKDDHFHTIAWFHVSVGIASIISAFVSGEAIDVNNLIYIWPVQMEPVDRTENRTVTMVTAPAIVVDHYIYQCASMPSSHRCISIELQVCDTYGFPLTRKFDCFLIICQC